MAHRPAQFVVGVADGVVGERAATFSNHRARPHGARAVLLTADACTARDKDAGVRAQPTPIKAS